MYQYEYFSIEEKSFSHEAVAPLMENTKPLEQVKKNDNRKRHRPINGGETGDCWGGEGGACVRKLFQAPLGCCAVPCRSQTLSRERENRNNRD